MYIFNIHLLLVIKNIDEFFQSSFLVGVLLTSMDHTFAKKNATAKLIIGMMHISHTDSTQHFLLKTNACRVMRN